MKISWITIFGQSKNVRKNYTRLPRMVRVERDGRTELMLTKLLRKKVVEKLKAEHRKQVN